ncbi:MAG: hypothetical protein EBY65_00225 [Acidimicrobiia bacterium]|nr:hypothetical protein [Acidimicrobiia bacterium]
MTYRHCVLARKFDIFPSGTLRPLVKSVEGRRDLLGFDSPTDCGDTFTLDGTSISRDKTSGFVDCWWGVRVIAWGK